MPNDLRTRLQELGADRLGHTHRSLMDHLVATGEILRGWDCDTDVCTAGMFHSIYGTNAFVLSCLDKSDRDHLKGIIGDRAEELVYLFCVSNRPIALLQGVRKAHLVNRHTGEVMKVSRTIIRDLLEIECANLIEQGAGHQFLAKLMSVARPILKQCVADDVERYLDPPLSG